jgi:proline racemase
MHSYLENCKELNLLAPQDIAAVATQSAYIDVGDAAGTIEFQIPFGAITSTDTTGGVVVTLEASTAGSSNATEQAISFRYRKSAAVATDTMGAITDATTTGVEILNAVDNITLFCFVEPAALAALGADFQWLRAVITPTAEVTVTLVGGVHVMFHARYAGNAIPSST